MKRALLFVIVCVLPVISLAKNPGGRGLVLDGDPVLFNEQFVPVFTGAQMRHTAQATRSGLATWAQTAEGHQWIARWRTGEYEVIVNEGGDRETLGRAEEPGIAAMVAMPDHAKLKKFYVTLNPDVANDYSVENSGFAVVPSAAMAMAAAWAGEMLHVSFYAAGIRLPHHDRAEFQARWRKVVDEIGMPTLKHGED